MAAGRARCALEGLVCSSGPARQGTAGSGVGLELAAGEAESRAALADQEVEPGSAEVVESAVVEAASWCCSVSPPRMQGQMCRPSPSKVELGRWHRKGEELASRAPWRVWDPP